MKLDIGSGAHYKQPLEEWTHLDLSKGDHTEIVCDFGSIPLDSGSVEEIHIGDVIEHVPGWRHDEVLKEWNRVLKIGGIITGSTPNIDRVMRAYARGEAGMTLHDALLNLYGWANHPQQQHYMTFTKETLRELMAKYGFDINDYSKSPGNPSEPWWLVFSGRKVQDVR